MRFGLDIIALGKGQPCDQQLCYFSDSFWKNIWWACSSFLFGKHQGQILYLFHGSFPVGQYVIRFWTPAAELAWNNEALTLTFWQGFAPQWTDRLGPTNRHSLSRLSPRKVSSVKGFLTLPGTNFPASTWTAQTHCSASREEPWLLMTVQPR